MVSSDISEVFKKLSANMRKKKKKKKKHQPTYSMSLYKTQSEVALEVSNEEGDRSRKPGRNGTA